MLWPALKRWWSWVLGKSDWGRSWEMQKRSFWVGKKILGGKIKGKERGKKWTGSIDRRQQQIIMQSWSKEGEKDY
jgi:hypothetical protein